MSEEIIAQAQKGITGDFGGFCLASKANHLINLLKSTNVKIALEIGVYRGSSLAIIAAATDADAVVYGVDPWLATEAYESNTPISGKINTFIDSLDWNLLHTNVCNLMREKFGDKVKIIRQTAEDAWSDLNMLTLDFIHIDGNHDTKLVSKDFALYVPMVRPGGIIVVDDTDWPSVQAAFPVLHRHQVELVEETNSYTVFRKL